MATETEVQNKFTDDQIKHLEFIQGVINRMGSNSFQMKGWMITIVSALLAIYADNNNWLYPLFGLLPTFIFWGLDAYYLQQERMFRGLYNNIAGISTPVREIKPFEMPLNLYKGDKYSYFNVFKSISVLPLYLPVVIILLVIAFVLTPNL